MLFWQLLHAGISTLFGYSAFVAFLVLGNYPSAVLALISGLSENILFFVHYLLWKRELFMWYGRTDLRLICRFGIVIAVVGLLNLGYHTTIQLLLKKPLLPISDSSVISIIWSFLALRSGLLLMYYCIKYQYLDEPVILDEDNAENLDTDPVTGNASTTTSP